MSEKNPFYRLDLFRSVLAFYFFLYAYVVARGMVPLPDEPPRIHFLSLFCLVGAAVIGYHCLVSRYRLFQMGVWLFIPFALKQLYGKIRFLEMMLEPNNIQKVTQFSLVVMLLIFLTPQAFRLFNRGAREYKARRPMVMPEGMQF